MITDLSLDAAPKREKNELINITLLKLVGESIKKWVTLLIIHHSM